MTAPTDSATTAQTGPQPRMRASDADREAVVHRLHDAVARGMLTIEEGHERVTAAYAARFLDDLPALTVDLPDPAPRAPGWRSLGSTAALQARTSLLGAATWGVADRGRRRLVLTAVILCTLLLVMVLTAAAASGGDGGWDGDYGHHWHHHWDD